MKALNVMNFARYIDERKENSTDYLYDVTKKELQLVNEFGFENTFLLQYDAVCDERYQKLFKETATEKTEVGLWYEIVEPLTSACGIPYESKRGWKWDWHIIPGFSMGYTPEQREKLADEAMRKFKEVFGYYPKTVASWLIDTHTINYLADNYDISAFAICRDQVNTDAYTLKGGYFNQAYYPSRNNVFTPAQSDDMRINVPVFRLLGPCPIHNYDSKKYISEELLATLGRYVCFTMEPGMFTGADPKVVDWFFRTFYENEDLGFSYCQVGQENSFGPGIIEPLRMQLEKVAALKNVKIQKMCDTGEEFKKLFTGKTPATSVVAMDNWDSPDIQSAYYDCQKYTANIMRFENSLFIRSLFLFDQRVKDLYIDKICLTPDAVYENMPLVNALEWNVEDKHNCGILIDSKADSFKAEKTDEGVLKISWNDKSVVFYEDKIEVTAEKLHFYIGDSTAEINLEDNEILYTYKDNNYRLVINNASVTRLDNGDFEISPYAGECTLCPEIIGDF